MVLNREHWCWIDTIDTLWFFDSKLEAMAHDDDKHDGFTMIYWFTN